MVFLKSTNGLNCILQMGILALVSTSGLAPKRAEASVVPDMTLGDEMSRFPMPTPEDASIQEITGGATRGTNLFHSFSEFSVLENQSVYFAPDGAIENILSRVTGDNPSNILGTLGVRTDANLWFVNPNGILFGDNAVLDIQGSFYATTADAIPFATGDAVFSAREPDSSTLLTVAPEVSFFNYLTDASGDISFATEASEDTALSGDLTLAGGSVEVLKPLQVGGDVRVEAHTRIQTSEIVTEGTDVRLWAGDRIETTGSIDVNGGDIQIEAGSGGIDVQFLRSNALQAGDITLEADGDIVTHGVFARSIASETSGPPGNGGNISITSRSGDITNNQRSLNNENALWADSFSGFSGTQDGGTITLSTTSGTITNYGNISATSFSAGGNTGNGGTITISTVSGSIVNNNMLRANAFSMAGNAGDGGQIMLSTESGNISNAELLRADSFTTANGAGDPTIGNSGNGGMISIASKSGDIVNGGQLRGESRAIFGNSGDGGDISVTSVSGEINNTDELQAYASSIQGNAGNGGSITLSSGAGGLSNDVALNANAFSRQGNTGNGGTIALISDGEITNSARLRADSSTMQGNSANGGAITLSAAGDITSSSSDDANEALSLLRADSSSTEGGAGNGGLISFSSAAGNIVITGDERSEKIAYRANAVSTNGDAGNGGTIELSAGGGIVTNASLSVDAVAKATGNAGNGGRVTLLSGGDLTINREINAGSDAEEGNAGNGGVISVTSALGSITANGGLDANVTSMQGNVGNGGTIEIRSTVGEIVNNGGLTTLSTAKHGDTGNGGDITISSTSGDIINAEAVTSNALSDVGDSGNGGTIDISSISGNIRNESLSSIALSESGNAGNGGDITVVSGSGHIEHVFSNSSSFLLTGTSGSTGNAGNVEIRSDRGDITVGDIIAIAYSPNGRTGNGGDIVLEALAGDITSNGSIDGEDRGGLFSFSSGPVASGDGGAARLTAGNTISGVEIITLASGDNSGDITIDGPADLTIQNIQLISSAQVRIPDPTIPDKPLNIPLEDVGQAGKVTITSQGNLAFENVEIISNANGAMAAGNIDIFGSGDVTFAASVVNSNALNAGNAGQVHIEAGENIDFISSQVTSSAESSGNAGLIDIQAGNRIQLSSDSELTAQTASTGQAGGIQLRAPQITVKASQISTSTEGDGDAGDITFNVTDSVQIDRSIIRSSTELGSTGNGGTISFENPAEIALQNSSRITVEAAGTGRAGNVDVIAGQLTLDGGSEIKASTQDNSGGNLRFILEDFLFLLDGSLISTEAEVSGNGGRITISSDFVIAIPEENSDIIANAFNGTGGQVDITAIGIFGLVERSGTTDDLRGNRSSDISASSQFGRAGAINLSPLVADPTQSLSNLSEGFINADSLISNSCIARDRSHAEGNFTLSNLSGLPHQPGRTQGVTFPTGEVQPISGSPTLADKTEAWQSGQTIMEPDGLYQLPDGRLVLSHRCEHAVPADG